jgi:gamma-glutamylputrescine oxidase
MTISYWLDENQKKTLNYDILIIGAGIAGLSTAYWLEKKDPSLKIAIIEKHSLAFGASGRNAGFVTCGSANHFNKLQKNFGFEKAIEIWKFSEQNRELLKTEIIQDRIRDVDYFSTGSCTVSSSEEDWSQQQNVLVKDMLRAGIDVELIYEKDLFSQYGVKNSPGGIQYKHDGIIHPIKLLNLLKSRLKNTSFYFGEEVFTVSSGAPSVKVESQKNIFSGAKLFVCLNGFTGQLMPEFKKLIKPQRAQAVVTEPLPAFVKGPCYLTKHLCYFRQLPTGELLVGGFRNADLEAENTALDEATEKIQNALTEFIHGYFTQAARVQIKYRWSGIMGFSADEQMLVGKHPERQNTYIMAGCASHGMGLSFNVGRVLVDSAFGIKPPAHLDIQRAF